MVYIDSDDDLHDVTVPQTPAKPNTKSNVITMRISFFIISRIIIYNWFLNGYNSFPPQNTLPHKKQNNEKKSGQTNFFVLLSALTRLNNF